MAELSDKVTIPVRCRMCGKVYKLRVYPEDWARYQEGALVQDAFPYIPREQRELLISGTCPECWDKMFGQFDD